jgi:hypothetical protein
MPEKCNHCGGDGYVIDVRTEPDCCGNVFSSGECKSYCAIPKEVPFQKPCECGQTYEEALASAIENGVLVGEKYYSLQNGSLLLRDENSWYPYGVIKSNRPLPIPEGWEVVITEKCDSKHYWETAKLVKK